MKKKILYAISITTLCLLGVCNINFLSNGSIKSILCFTDIEALASGETGGNIGKYYQIIAGCGSEGIHDWIDWCCRGSETSCIKDPCKKGIKNGCDTHGRLELE